VGDIIDLDWMVDIRKAVDIFDDRVALCGNFDPVAVMLQGQKSRSKRQCIIVWKMAAALLQRSGLRNPRGHTT